MKIDGTVEAVSQKSKGYGIKIGDAWFNGFGACPWAKGATVSLEYEVNNKGYNDIKPDPKANTDKTYGLDKNNEPEVVGQVGQMISKDDFWKAKNERDIATQEKISKQWAINASIEMLSKGRDGILTNDEVTIKAGELIEIRNGI